VRTHVYKYRVYSAQVTPSFLKTPASAYVSIRQHTLAYVSIRQHTQTSAYVSIRQHTSAYADVSIRQHTSAYVSIRQHTSAYVRAVAEGMQHRQALAEFPEVFSVVTLVAVMPCFLARTRRYGELLTPSSSYPYATGL
jgi:hypothetical protein